MSLALKIAIPVAAVGAIFAVAHVAMATPVAEVLPEALQAQVSRALKSADPDAMRKLATSLRSRGYPGQAKSLEDAADEIQKAIQSAEPAGVVPRLKGKVRQAVTATGLVMPAAKSVSMRSLAGQVALAFTGLTPGNETAADKALLKRFQTEEAARGFYRGNIDGLYGPKSALALANDHNIVPPRPLYWPKTNVAASKAAYVAKLDSKANADPQRAEEWRQAAQV